MSAVDVALGQELEPVPAHKRLQGRGERRAQVRVQVLLVDGGEQSELANRVPSGGVQWTADPDEGEVAFGELPLPPFRARSLRCQHHRDVAARCDPERGLLV